jgi:hypothetical protein
LVSVAPEILVAAANWIDAVMQRARSERARRAAWTLYHAGLLLLTCRGLDAHFRTVHLQVQRLRAESTVAEREAITTEIVAIGTTDDGIQRINEALGYLDEEVRAGRDDWAHEFLAELVEKGNQVRGWLGRGDSTPFGDEADMLMLLDAVRDAKTTEDVTRAKGLASGCLTVIDRMTIREMYETSGRVVREFTQKENLPPPTWMAGITASDIPQGQ